VCSDGSDEAECEEEDYRTCSEDERACHNGKCIHLSKVGPMICRYIDEGLVGSGMGLFLIIGQWPKILPQNSKGDS
jgi:hypothetical protein